MIEKSLSFHQKNTERYRFVESGGSLGSLAYRRQEEEVRSQHHVQMDPIAGRLQLAIKRNVIEINNDSFVISPIM